MFLSPNYYHAFPKGHILKIEWLLSKSKWAIVQLCVMPRTSNSSMRWLCPVCTRPVDLILISSQPVFGVSLSCCGLGEEETNTKCIVFGFTLQYPLFFSVACSYFMKNVLDSLGICNLLCCCWSKVLIKIQVRVELKFSPVSRHPTLIILQQRGCGRVADLVHSLLILWQLYFWNLTKQLLCHATIHIENPNHRIKQIRNWP
jgi:hypothetical protein